MFSALLKRWGQSRETSAMEEVVTSAFAKELMPDLGID